ncbi:MAG: NUDIX hydrolase [Bacteroidota bacterium]
MIIPAQPAATILIAREQNNSLEVLLLRRNKALKFAGGLWVFPGGKIEKEELAATETELEAAKLAAVRETMEEANIEIDPDRLLFFNHWLTPIRQPKRFGAYFFFAELADPNASVKVDDSEIKDYLWISPQAALERVADRTLSMMPPTFISLQRIQNCRTIQSAKEALSKTPPIYILPVLRFMDGAMVCLYEGDAGYETGDMYAKGPRHRLTANMKTGQFKFEYSGCDHVMPVNIGA